MATENRLTATIQTKQAEQISDLARDHGIPDTEAERKVVQEGLASLGYADRPTTNHGLWLYYFRFIGHALGLAGLAVMALGVFWGRITGVYGFALLVGAFLIVAVVDGLQAYSDRLEAR